MKEECERTERSWKRTGRRPSQGEREEQGSAREVTARISVRTWHTRHLSYSHPFLSRCAKGSQERGGSLAGKPLQENPTYNRDRQSRTEEMKKCVSERTRLLPGLMLKRYEKMTRGGEQRISFRT